MPEHENKFKLMHSIELLKLCDEQNFRVVMYDYADSGCDEPHIHSYIQIWYVKEGVYRNYFAGTEFSLSAGSLMIIPPYYPHYIDSRDGVKLVRIDISREFLDDLCGADAKDPIYNLVYLDSLLVQINKLEPYRYFSKESISELDTVLLDLAREYEKIDSFTHLFIRANLSRLFAIIAKEYRILDRDRVVSKYREAFQNAISYINTHYMEKLRVDDVCRISLLSRRSFFYLFKSMMGMSFTHYIQYMRVLRAKELLRETNQTQYAICKNCGFSDQAHFHRVFKKFTGLLPGQYHAEHFGKSKPLNSTEEFICRHSLLR